MNDSSVICDVPRLLLRRPYTRLVTKVSNLSAQGTLRLGLTRLVPQLPGFGAMLISFARVPQVRSGLGQCGCCKHGKVGANNFHVDFQGCHSVLTGSMCLTTYMSLCMYGFAARYHATLRPRVCPTARPFGWLSQSLYALKMDSLSVQRPSPADASADALHCAVLFCAVSMSCFPAQIKFSLDLGPVLGGKLAAKPVVGFLDPFLRDTLASMLVWPNRYSAQHVGYNHAYCHAMHPRNTWVSL